MCYKMLHSRYQVNKRESLQCQKVTKLRKEIRTILQNCASTNIYLFIYLFIFLHATVVSNDNCPLKPLLLLSIKFSQAHE